ncbi:MAG: hypothetical protein NTW94_06255 [Legionellales bacterium]|nr:hypothetical protein [Legionellales bacterium]
MVNEADLKIQIAQKLDQLQEKVLSLTGEHLIDEVVFVTDDYASLFADLFGGVGQDSYIDTFNHTTPREAFQFYLQTLHAIQQTIQRLPFPGNIKETLLAKISDNINLNFLKKFEEKTLIESDYSVILEQSRSDVFVNVAQVKTWGTTDEISSGLRSIVQHHATGESIGHTAVVMRIAGDPKGAALIKKYCLHDDGTIKIPFEIKQHGPHFMYEVYWSFWPPGGLKTIEEDLADLRNTEENDPLNIFKAMPMELKTRYLTQRYTKVSQIPEFLVPNALKKPTIFSTRIPKTRIMAVPPVATLDLETLEPDEFRRQFLNTKLEQYQLRDELHSLNVLKENYFSEGKPFDPNRPESMQSIDAKSNFLLLLHRFRKGFTDESMVARILLTHQITPIQSTVLLNDINRLIESRQAAIEHIDQDIEKSSNLMLEHKPEFFLIKHQIHELQNKLLISKNSVKMAETLDTLIHQKLPLSLSPEQIRTFTLFSGAFDSSLASPLIQKVVNSKTITPVDAETFKDLLRDYLPKIKAGMTKNKRLLFERMKDFTTLNDTQKVDRLAFVSYGLAHNAGKLVQYASGGIDITKGHAALLKKQAELLALQVRLKINLNTTSDDFLQRNIHLGSSNDVTLRGFDLEKMLQKASELLSGGHAFHLGRENCSTSTMKLLNAGAPDELKTVFEWDERREGEIIPSNALLTNPQSVFSAARLAELSARGHAKAQEFIRTKKTAQPERDYNRVLNEIVKEVTTETRVVSPSTFKMGVFFFKCLPYLFKLYRDIFQSAIQFNKRVAHEQVPTKIASEIKALNGGAYQLIDSPSPSLAIHRMLSMLCEDKSKIPFFETDTLARVETYILSIKAKSPKTIADKAALANHQRIESVRNDRIQAVELAMISRKATREILEQKERPSVPLIWTMSDAEKAHAFVQHVLITYQLLRNQDPLSFLRKNFAGTLDKNASHQDKLQKIHEQITHYPNGRTAKAVETCLDKDPVLREFYTASCGHKLGI